MSNSLCRKALSSRACVMRVAASSALFTLLAAPASHAAETGHGAMAMPMPSTESMPAPTSALAAPFGDYRRWRDDPVQDWRQSNDRVGEIGGWMTYLREVQPADDDAGKSGHGRMHDHSGH